VSLKTTAPRRLSRTGVLQGQAPASFYADFAWLSVVSAAPSPPAPDRLSPVWVSALWVSAL
jgi:hypothetical protein